MRVVAGLAKGRELRVPKSDKTRPTTDKVRDAIFNVVAADIEGAVVLDLFAGSGAMAIEALSRGAAEAELVEDDRDAVAVIRRNLELAGMQQRATVWPMPVHRALSKVGRQFDIIVADPPYSMPGIHELAERLSESGLLGPGGVLVLEHGKRFDAKPVYGRLVRWQEKRYGDTSVSFYVVPVDSVIAAQKEESVT